MPDPFGKVNPGDQRGQHPARAYNDMLDAAEFVRRERLSGGQNQVTEGRGSQTRLLVKNTTSGPVSKFGILSLDTPVVLPSDSLVGFQARVAMKGIAPSTTKSFGILLETIDKDAMGDVTISGVVQVQINMTNAAHKYAKVIAADSTKLVSDIAAGVEIVWAETGTGTKWAYVNLDKTGKPLTLTPFCASIVTAVDLGACTVTNHNLQIKLDSTDPTILTIALDDTACP